MDAADADRSAIPSKTLDDLQWARVVDAVAARRRGPIADGWTLPIASTEEGARLAMAETAEALALLAGGDPLPLDGLREVRHHLDRVERGGALDGPGLADVASTLGAARVLRRFLGGRRARCPRLDAACASDPSLSELEDEICEAVEPAGTLSDAASPDLGRLRSETASLRARLVSRLEDLLVRHSALLSDRFYTQREGRYVLPVRSDAHERLPGIVHGASASGATIFVEPRALVASGNRLRIAESELEREEARILAVLSERVKDRLPELRSAVDALERADVRSASALLGHELGGVMPLLVDEPRVRLREARHPVLLLDGASVVPNDLEIGSGRALVVSGPNAGGKTVAMKLVGLAALMLRAGLPLPVAEGSECGFFSDVLTDVGDEQSISRNLSTFSAHVTNLAGILQRAGPRALVLLDELAGGTDPDEGAALACALVEALCSRGAAVIVTTHYEPLKALALSDARMRNASVGFDVQRLAPTFHLMLGVPGASSALAVASRYGIPDAVTVRATALLPERSRGMDDLARRLESEWRALEAARVAADDDRAKAAEARAAAEAELARARSREAAELERDAASLREAVRRARDEVRDARAKIRERADDARVVDDAARAVEEAAATIAIGSDVSAAIGAPSEPSGPAPAPGTLRAGMRVWVTRLRTEADVVEAPARGRVRVAAGAMKLWVGEDEVRLLAPASVPRAGKSASAGRASGPSPGADEVVYPRSEENTLDVRGMRVDDAVGMLETFVDRLFGASVPLGFVLHGVGTGALREAVRGRLTELATYVVRHRSGTSDEGGDRFTVFYLR